jgi:peptidyl-prolyl cis-trans isomerase C
MKSIGSCLVLGLIGALALTAQAAAQSLPKGAAATVNGVVISESLLEKVVQNNVIQGLQDSPQLRQGLKEELIAREILAQQAEKLGLDKRPEVEAQWAEVRQNFLIDLVFNDFLVKSPITDIELQAEYDRQLAAVKEMGNLQQYQLSQILLGHEADARTVLLALKNGSSFEQLARDKSLDGSKAQGGLIGWVLPNQILPEISNVVVNLGKGVVAAAPIQTRSGWHVIRVDDLRPFKAPAFDDIKAQLRSSAMQAKRLELLAALKESAKVKQ